MTDPGSDLETICKAVCSRLAPALPDWNTLWFQPVIIKAPMVSVSTRDPFSDTYIAQGNSTAAKWMLEVGLYLSIPAANEEPVRSKMSTLTGTRGPVRSLLMDRIVEDDLYTLCLRRVKTGKWRGNKVIHRNGGRFLQATLEVDLTSHS